MTDDITDDDAKARIARLMDADQRLVSLTRTGSTEARTFFTVARCWPHPDIEDMTVLNIQNAQLTAEWSGMEDTFLKGGWRQRVPEGNGDLLRHLAQDLAGAAAQADAGTLGSRAVDVNDATEGDR